MSFLFDEQGTDSHGSFQLQGLPVWSIHHQRDGVILNAGLCLLAQADTFRNEVHQLAGHRNLTLRLFRETDTDSVTNALSQQSPDADGRFDTTVFSLSGFRHAKMQGIVHILLIHCLDQQTDGSHHHYGIGCLDADDDVIELFPSADAQKLHATLDDTLGSITIARHDAVRQRAVVHTNANGGMMLLTNLQERHQLGFYLLQLGSIFLIGIFQVLEGPAWIDVVAGIDAHLLTILGGDISSMCRKVCLVAIGLQACRDVLHVLCLTGALGGKPYQFTSGIDDALGLTDTAFRIIGIYRSHRLDAYGIVATDTDCSHMGNRRRATLISVLCFHLSCYE